MPRPELFWLSRSTPRLALADSASDRNPATSGRPSTATVTVPTGLQPVKQLSQFVMAGLGPGLLDTDNPGVLESESPGGGQPASRPDRAASAGPSTRLEVMTIWKPIPVRIFYTFVIYQGYDMDILAGKRHDVIYHRYDMDIPNLCDSRSD